MLVDGLCVFHGRAANLDKKVVVDPDTLVALDTNTAITFDLYDRNMDNA